MESLPPRKRKFYVAVAIVLLGGAAVAAYVRMQNKEPLRGTLVEVREGKPRIAMIQLRNVSAYDASFRATRIFYRFNGEEWNTDPPYRVFKCPKNVMPNEEVSYPVALVTKDGSPLHGKCEVGISYSHAVRNFPPFLPEFVGSALGNLGISKGKRMRGVYWITLDVP